ncbi:MAG: hypothetical protein AAFR61_14805 [Bacteroidota bacterium]
MKYNLSSVASSTRLLLMGGLFFGLWVQTACAQKLVIPKVHHNMSVKRGKVVVEYRGKDVTENTEESGLNLKAMHGNPKGFGQGILFDFGLPTFAGSIYYGLIPYGDSKHPLPVFRRQTDITEGKAQVVIKKNLSGRYDMVGWEESGHGTIGYRVVSADGLILYDGRVTFSGTGPFKVDAGILEGPFVNLLTPEGATISFETNKKVAATISVGGKEFTEEEESLHHEIKLSGLEAAQAYDYTVSFGNVKQTYGLTTAPAPGSRQPFKFAYASDSRSGQGGGERDVFGANNYIMKKIMALATYQGVSFMQFSGDLINGYLTDPGMQNLQYANWKRGVEPFAHYFPIYVSMGNHEALTREMVTKERIRISVDRFPYATESAEAIFKDNFVLPENGPDSEDGASYDPDPEKIDFPSYKENVFYYTYDNLAVIVLNSDYWYAPSSQAIPLTSGGLHGYIMDKQLAWLGETLKMLEGDENIDHVIVTQHTPAFPNGGHTQDDMWYSGNNMPRPYVAGKPVEDGIIERRDQYLDLLVNQSSKVIAILTGDEHNYAKTEIGPETNIYPDSWASEKLDFKRTIWQINNGAAGAPYYAQEQTPWTPFVTGFTTQHALVIFKVDGKKLSMEVRNPDTLEEVDTLELR